MLPHLIWIPTYIKRYSHLKKIGENTVVQFATFIQHSSNGREHSFMHPHSGEKWTNVVFTHFLGAVSLRVDYRMRWGRVKSTEFINNHSLRVYSYY